MTFLTEDQPDRSGWLAGCAAYEARLSQARGHLLEEMQAETGIDVASLHDNWKRSDKTNLPFLTGGTYLVDYDRDGRIDILVTDLKGLTLYHGRDGGRFVNVTLAAGLPPLSPPGEPPPLGAVFADFDNDGFPDLVLGSRLYHNVSGTRFDLRALLAVTRLEIASGRLAVFGGRLRSRREHRSVCGRVVRGVARGAAVDRTGARQLSPTVEK
ncbi:MAG: hypothetical protein CM1200mP2_34210 [Planctomycetaceae bacterium]|nr:MAG: hypothetical protein CM1200mP2_34210 [Planctomycetaceae bacterium]